MKVNIIYGEVWTFHEWITYFRENEYSKCAFINVPEAAVGFERIYATIYPNKQVQENQF